MWPIVRLLCQHYIPSWLESMAVVELGIWSSGKMAVFFPSAFSALQRQGLYLFPQFHRQAITGQRANHSTCHCQIISTFLAQCLGNFAANVPLSLVTTGCDSVITPTMRDHFVLLGFRH